MRKSLFTLITLVFATTAQAQDGINQLLTAGIEDAERFSKAYFTPATETIMYNLSSGWANNGSVNNEKRVTFSIIANASFINDSSKSFFLDFDEYESDIEFDDGNGPRNVATALGANENDILIRVSDDNILTQDATFTLPQGIGNESIEQVPTAFLQLGVRIIDGLEVKARVVPKINYDDVETFLYGFGGQYEITSLLGDDSKFPLAISAVVGYTNFSGSYDFTETSLVDGENQRFEYETNVLTYGAIASTNWKIFNVYAGVAQVDGNSTTDVLGTYRVRAGIFVDETIEDPFSFDNDVSGIKANAGFNLQLGFFGINADYTFADYDNATVGINFAF